MSSGLKKGLINMAANSTPTLALVLGKGASSIEFKFKSVTSMPCQSPCCVSLAGKHLNEKPKLQSKGRNDVFCQYSVNKHTVLKNTVQS